MGTWALILLNTEKLKEFFPDTGNEHELDGLPRWKAVRTELFKHYDNNDTDAFWNYFYKEKNKLNERQLNGIDYCSGSDSVVWVLIANFTNNIRKHGKRHS